ncbi:MAG: HAD family hydrolase, partial [Firmicutes bacterium]|nr:HAD family hydrolase [Bacillota bacterium]
SNLAKAFLIPIFETAVLDEEAVPLLKELKENGYLTGLISNTPWGSPSYLWLQELNRHGLTQYLDDVVFCVDAGRRKPHPDIFHYALERLEVSAQDTIFVGDDPKWDIYGARQAGISPILLNPAEGVVTDDESIRRLSELVERV